MYLAKEAGKNQYHLFDPEADRKVQAHRRFLETLRKLPVDLLKIDQSFIRDMLVDPDDLGIVEGVIRLAAAFNRDVIAEGVETLEHGAALLRLGCHRVQGYGIARPMPREPLPPWLTRWQHDAAWVGQAGRPQS
ncbi:MAG: EAL domain-containing protein [Burkholderiales bacterium]|nr:EAL domain-containing protein [Burkholderiales bacterium]